MTDHPTSNVTLRHKRIRSIKSFHTTHQIEDSIVEIESLKQLKGSTSLEILKELPNF